MRLQTCTTALIGGAASIVIGAAAIMAAATIPVLWTAGKVVGAALPKALFRTLVDEDPAFRNQVFSVFASRLCSLLTLIEEMARTRLDERLADLLVSRGPVIHATHQGLADELGTAREVVSRILEHLARLYDRAVTGS